MQYVYLDKITSPADVKKLDNNQVKTLCAEIRDCIINTVSKNGGHLASNLGSVELTVAVHRAFSAPQDAIIFDVGHQCYTHKLITGRYDRFSTLRQENGISGFMRPMESIYDPFVTGHSSNSISAAYGIYKSKAITGESGTAVAVIGDGALTGGMVYEAMNNVGASRNRFIVILNDNKMSISRNVGAMARALTKMRNKPRYHYFKFAVTDFLNKIPFVGKPISRLIFSVKELLKAIIYKDNFFKSLGFNYLGPVDGHDVEAMESLFKVAQNYPRPTLIHVVTVKGKGYPFAEEAPKNYHGVSPFDVCEGAAHIGNKTFSSVAGESLCALAEKDQRVCAVTAAMTEGTGLLEFRQRFKNRFFDVGIAEQHGATFCAGLSTGKLRPYFAVYSSFLQRAYDQIVHDNAIANLPTTFLVDRAGIVGADGESHQGTLDVAFLRSIPNMNIYSPSGFNELKYLILNSANKDELSAIRYPRGAQKRDYDFDFSCDFTLLSKKSNKCAVTYGRIFDEVYEAWESSDFDIIKLNKIYPLSKEFVNSVKKYDEIHFFEEVNASGGIGELTASLLFDGDYSGKFRIHALSNEFIGSCSYEDALKKYGLDCESVKKVFGR